MTAAIGEGGTLPEIELTAPAGGKIKLRDYLGKPLVLYFYPKDDTAGCTREAQEFSEQYEAFKALGADILGVSRDAPAKHQKFTEKYGLTVPLATDEDESALAAFGVWVEKSLYGRKYMGIDRSTFLFDKNGTLVRAWRKVRVPGHVEAVLAAVKELG